MGTNNWRTRTPVELAPGRTVYVEDMTSIEFEEWSEMMAKAKGSADVGQALAVTAFERTYLDAEGNGKAFASADEARRVLSFKQLNWISQEAAASSVQESLAARFRDGDGTGEGVGAVPDGAGVRPAAVDDSA